MAQRAIPTPIRSTRVARGSRRQDPQVVIGEITRHESPATIVARVIAADIEREQRNYRIRMAAKQNRNRLPNIRKSIKTMAVWPADTGRR